MKKITTFKAMWAGRTMGHRYAFGLPTIIIRKTPQPLLGEETLPPFVREVFGIAKSQMQRIAQSWQKMDSQLASRISATKERVDQLEERAANINRTDLGREPGISQPVYVIAMLIVSAGEFLFNSVVFQVLGQSTIETYVIALVIAVGFPFLGHLNGAWLKETGKPTAKSAIVTVTAFAGSLVVAVMRMSFFEASGVAEVLGIKLAPTTMAAVFTVINVLLFVVSSSLSYENHEQKPDERKLLTEYEAAKELLERLIAHRARIFALHVAQAEEVAEGFSAYADIFDYANQKARASHSPGQAAWVHNCQPPEIPECLKGLIEIGRRDKARQKDAMRLVRNRRPRQRVG